MTSGDWNAMREVERQDAARLERELSPAQALRLFEGMWQMARSAETWQQADATEGLEVDIEVARTIHSLKGAPHV